MHARWTVRNPDGTRVREYALLHLERFCTRMKQWKNMIVTLLYSPNDSPHNRIKKNSIWEETNEKRPNIRFLTYFSVFFRICFILRWSDGTLSLVKGKWIILAMQASHCGGEKCKPHILLIRNASLIFLKEFKTHQKWSDFFLFSFCYAIWHQYVS